MISSEITTTSSIFSFFINRRSYNIAHIETFITFHNWKNEQLPQKRDIYPKTTEKTTKPMFHSIVPWILNDTDFTNVFVKMSILYCFKETYLILHWLVTNNFFSKVKTLWEGHKIWKNLSSVLTKQLFLLNSVKTSGIFFFSNFVAFSEKLDFKLSNV